MYQSLIILVLSLSILSSKGQADSTFLKAEFVYGIDELNQLTSFLQTFPPEQGSFVSAVEKATVPIKFIVSPEGIVENIKLDGFISIEYRWARRDMTEKYYKWYYEKQAIAICKFSEGLWIPAEKNGVSCLDTIKHIFVFQWKDKNHYNWKYDFETESDEMNFFFFPNIDSSKQISQNRFFLLYNSKPSKNFHSESAGVMYYNFALEKLKEKKYFIAERMFKLANLKNSTNDCLYNLVVTQLNLGWNKDACINLEKLVVSGDKEAISLMDKYCK